MDFKIKAKQDFIFFGVSFIEEWFSEEETLQFKWFVHDGALVLKNQTCCIVRCENRTFSLDKLLDFLCYLSGGATLVRCFVNSSSVPVVASATEYSILKKNKEKAFSEYSFNKIKGESVLFKKKYSEEKHFPKGRKDYKPPSIHSLAYWEEESVKAGGGQLEPRIPEQIFQDKEVILRNLKSLKKIFCFHADYLNTSKMASLVMKLPENVIKGVYGSFRPEHCKAFPSSTFQVLWPSLLQGYFPRVQMIRCSD